MKLITKTFPALCAGPLMMLAVAASAATSDGSSSSYESDVEMAVLLESTCEWNTYMCCWTEGITDNTDVCRVFDYPAEGDVLEMPRNDEGPTYCHGFAWKTGADAANYIMPLYNHVTNLGDFSGNVEGAPECGCIEEMPVVDDAACSEYNRDGIVPCKQGGLGKHYAGYIGKPNGKMDSNLVGECDNVDVPEFDFNTCEHNTYMCCWTENDGQGMADNTDVCRVGATEYPADTEGEVHCHGFVWAEGATDKHVHLLAQYVQNFDHDNTRGYYGNCIEDMPEVSRADCSKHKNKEGKFKACKNNDLRTEYEILYPDTPLANLVEQCDNA
eukprot:g3225.t1